MAYDDADNRIDDAAAGYVTSDGHVLYVYDSASDVASTNGAYAYASDATGTAGHMRYPAGREAARADIEDDADDLRSRFGPLFLAYDAAQDSLAYNDFDDDFDDEADFADEEDESGFTSLDELAASFGVGNDDDINTGADEDGAALAALMDDAAGVPAAALAKSYGVAVNPVIYGGAEVERSATRRSSRGVVAIDDIAAGNPEAEAAVAALRVRHAQMRRRRGAYVLMTAGVAAIAVLAVFVNYLMGLDEAMTATAGGAAEVVRGDLAFTVAASGRVAPLSSVAVLPATSGVVSEVYVSEGDVVEEGNVLFLIANDALDEAVTAATERLNSANDELRRASAAVTAAYDTYNAEVDTYRAGQNPAFNESVLLSAISLAEANRDRALSAANAARNELEAANDRASARYVTAPVAGTVTGVSIQPGDAVTSLAPDTAPDKAPIQVADVSQVRVSVLLSEQDVANVAVGQRATVSLVEEPAVTSEGVVESISDQPSGDTGSAAACATILVSNPNHRLSVDAQVSVAITTDVAADVLTVPSSAVRTEEGSSRVWVVTDLSTGRSEKRDVAVGATNGKSVIVTKGLSEGDMVGLP